MKIGGFQPFTLTDYPGQVAAIVFTQGCNWRCPYCHNAQLLPTDRPKSELIPETYVLEHLSRRRRQVDGLVITGGEPTIQEDLPSFIRQARRLGLKIKLDTNGSQPDVIRRLLEENLLDYVAMDSKAPLDQYESVVRRPVDTDAIQTSVELIRTSGTPYEFRTTAPETLWAEDIAANRKQLPVGSPHRP